MAPLANSGSHSSKTEATKFGKREGDSLRAMGIQPLKKGTDRERRKIVSLTAFIIASVIPAIRLSPKRRGAMKMFAQRGFLL
jgi:hypothetical protein